jgi:hypothetical protein
MVKAAEAGMVLEKLRKNKISQESRLGRILLKTHDPIRDLQNGFMKRFNSMHLLNIIIKK